MQFTRGDTFRFSGPVVLTVNGAPMTDLTGFSATCQIRSVADDTLIDDVVVSWSSYSPAVIVLTGSGSTAAWPVGEAKISVLFNDGSGVLISTKTTLFQILMNNTR